MPSSHPRVSVVIPTFNESENLEALLAEFARLRESWSGTFDIVFIDDNSPDGTGSAAVHLARSKGLAAALITRYRRRGIGEAILDGIQRSDSDLICVMDADLSHPPSVIPRLVESLDGADGVVASRYVDGSRIIRWPIVRRTISLAATCLARLMLSLRCRDPLSGYFLFRRTSVQDARLSGLGGKPLLEILVHRSLVIREVPYAFRNRENGQSKFTIRNVLEFAQLIRLLLHAETRRGEVKARRAAQTREEGPPGQWTSD